MSINHIIKLKDIKNTSFNSKMHLHQYMNLVPTIHDCDLLILIGLFLIKIEFNDMS